MIPGSLLRFSYGQMNLKELWRLDICSQSILMPSLSESKVLSELFRARLDAEGTVLMMKFTSHRPWWSFTHSTRKIQWQRFLLLLHPEPQSLIMTLEINSCWQWLWLNLKLFSTVVIHVLAFIFLQQLNVLVISPWERLVFVVKHLH